MTHPSSLKKVVVLALPGARELDLASVLDVCPQNLLQLCFVVNRDRCNSCVCQYAKQFSANFRVGCASIHAQVRVTRQSPYRREATAVQNDATRAKICTGVRLLRLPSLDFNWTVSKHGVQ
jgi:hypothetical protein